MTSCPSRPIQNLFLLLAILGLPLLGAVVSGRDLSAIFRFPPPLEIPSNYLRFSWLAAGSVIGVGVLIVASWLFGRRSLPTASSSVLSKDFIVTKNAFPIWGWAALVWTLGWWAIAWTRMPVFAAVQCYTFFPLWLGFIIAVNAQVEHRTGSCRLTRSPRQWLLLFGASAFFWWSFEWLSRFVHNWHYLGVSDFGPLGYGTNATLCFSTVLPAVAAVADTLQSYPRWRRRVRNGPSWRWFERRSTAVIFVVGGLGALFFTGVDPPHFYPALWAAPLALALGASLLSGDSALPREMARGDWERAATWMIAGVICGFFWELWNWRSLAKWIYTVPGVDRWPVFEMPLLGYSGYLPFGLECLLIIERLGGSSESVKPKSADPQA